MTPFPTVHSATLGEIVFRSDNDPPWVSIVPAALCPPLTDGHPLDVYIEGSSSHPDAGCLSLAEDTALNLLVVQERCQRALALKPGKNAEQQFLMMWLSFTLREGVPSGEAVFTLSSGNVLNNDVYSLWIVTLSQSEPLSVRRDFW